MPFFIRSVLGTLLILSVVLAPIGIAVVRGRPLGAVVAWNVLGLPLLGLGWVMALLSALNDDNDAAAAAGQGTDTGPGVSLDPELDDATFAA